MQGKDEGWAVLAEAGEGNERILARAEFTNSGPCRFNADDQLRLFIPDLLDHFREEIVPELPWIGRHVEQIGARHGAVRSHEFGRDLSSVEARRPYPGDGRGRRVDERLIVNSKGPACSWGLLDVNWLLLLEAGVDMGGRVKETSYSRRRAGHMGL